MRDLFDDFMEELRRREALARGQDPDAGAARRRSDRTSKPRDDEERPDDESDADSTEASDDRDDRDDRDGG